MSTRACKKCGSIGHVSKRGYCRDCGVETMRSAGAEWHSQNFTSDMTHEKRMATRMQFRAANSEPDRWRTLNVEPYEAADCIGDPDCRRPATHHGMCSRHYSQSTKGQNA